MICPDRFPNVMQTYTLHCVIALAFVCSVCFAQQTFKHQSHGICRFLIYVHDEMMLKMMQLMEKKNQKMRTHFPSDEINRAL